jgi:hypothetical protein
MTMQEQCDLELEMLEHFKLSVKEPYTYTNADGTKAHGTRTKHPDMQAAVKALKISQSFLLLAQSNDPPVDLEEMVLSIRYRMGYGWWTWLFIRHFAIPIIKWLWNTYHNNK